MNLKEGINLPIVSVVVPMKNEANFIEKCINSLLKQEYPKDKFEMIIVDGRSKDNSVEIVKNIAQKHSNIRLLKGTGPTIAADMNIGINDAKGEIIAKVDAHGYVAYDFLQKSVKHLTENNDVACVGGPIRQIGESFVAKSNAYARSSIFGVGKGIYSTELKSQFVDTVQCGVYKREIFNKVGLFDGTLWGEDEELNWRIRKAGYKIFLTPEIKFFYYARPSLKRLFIQYFGYGDQRVKVIRKHPDFLRIKHLIPSAFILALIGNIILSLFDNRFLWLFLVIAIFYLFGSLTFSILISKKEGWQYLWALPISFVCLHFGYGWGFLQGIFNLIKTKIGRIKHWTKKSE